MKDPVVLIVPPHDPSILALSVAGASAASHIAGCFEGRDVRIVGGEASGTYEGNGRVSRFPVTAADLGVTSDRGVLVIDGRAWLSGPSAAWVVHSGTGVALTRAVEAGGEKAAFVLAVHLPPGAFHDAVIRRPDAGEAGLRGVLPDRDLAALRAVDAGGPDAPPGIALVRTLADLASMEAAILASRAEAAMARGVRLRDPRHVWLRGSLDCGERVEIDVNVVVEGNVFIGNDARIGANCLLRDVRLGDRVTVLPFSTLEGAVAGTDVRIGPYARVRPGSSLGDRVQVGNYVEIKNSEIGAGCRINHHSFIGDATVGREVTIGAGTITCNHDGVRIQRTDIEDGAYIGSGTRLVAPVRVGEHATIGAGSTITEDVPARALALARSRQTAIPDWRGRTSQDE
jgi:acetyltransferase-like isoleucine patch superfamily enzyme